MAYLLFPGRHLLNTRFQEEYLFSVLGRPLEDLGLQGPETLDELIIAVTSSNQANSRYNPIPFHVRAVGVDRFARRLKEALETEYRIVGIPHYGQTSRFASHTLKEIREQSEDALVLTPENTVVVCSTPALIADYRTLGYRVLTAEWDEATERHTVALPIDAVKRLAELGEAWKDDLELRRMLAPSAYGLFQDFPEVPQRITRMFRDPLLNDQGSLTDTRDYSTYARAMDSIIDLKYAEIKPGVVPGKIVDEGCADGALLVPLSRDFPDSDLIGIDIAAEFVARCRERQRAGEYGGSFVHVHQRNLLEPIFTPGSIDTTICNSTLHELWSYGDGQVTVDAYLAEKFRQTRPGGRLVIRDVVGFPEKEAPIFMTCRTDDGKNEGALDMVPQAELARHLSGLSTASRFRRFAVDFQAELREEGRRPASTRVAYTEAEVAGLAGFRLRFKDAVEFLTKKDYTDNWTAEMNEEFAFWSFDEWKQALARAGFRVIEDPNTPERGSRATLSAWRVANHFSGKVAFFKEQSGSLVPESYPVTGMVLVGEKA